MFEKGIRIEITGEIQKQVDKEFTPEEKEAISDKFLEFIENEGLVFIGITK